MTDYTCPVEGCDYGEQTNKTFRAIQSHVNATQDDDHRWSDLRDQIAAQGGDGADDDGDQAGDDVGRQWGGSSGSAGDDDPDDSDEGGDGDGNDGSDDSDGQGSLAVPVSGPVLVAALAGLFLVVLVLQYRRADDSDQDGVDVDVEPAGADAPAEATDDAGETDTEGGLIEGGGVDE